LKKNLPILIITIILAVIAIYFISTQRKATVKEELRDFAIADTAAISKIFIADKGGKQATLVRQSNNRWMVNNKFYVDESKINTLLETMKNLRVRTRVGKMEFNTIVNDMAATAVKCEIYTTDQNKPAKIYYIGHETQDMLGTYMLMDGSSTPFVMEIPGFNGYLNSRFFGDEKEWRDHIIFDYKPEDIRSLTFTFVNEPAKSFKIESDGKVLKLSSPVTRQIIPMPDTVALETYLGFYSFIAFEAFDVEYSQRQRDSIFLIGPSYIISITDKSGKENAIKIFPKPITQRSLAQTDPQGKPLKYDVDRMYALVNNDQDFVVIQQFSFGKLFRQLTDFKAISSKKN